MLPALLGKRWRRLRLVRRLRARSRLRTVNDRSVERALARPRPPVPACSATAAGEVEIVYGAPRTLLFVTVKRDNSSWRSLYGHWWVEVDGDRSYGWWPACVPLRARDLLRGTDGVLNGVGLVGLRGSWDRDPNHGQEAMHAFHPLLAQPLSDDEVRARLAGFAHAYQARWRWHWSQRRSSGTCRAFQEDLLSAAGLHEGVDQLHTRGSGCPFLYPPRRVWWSALDAADGCLRRVRMVRPARQDAARPGGGGLDSVR